MVGFLVVVYEFNVLVYMVEMLFKDNDDLLDFDYGWFDCCLY